MSSSNQVDELMEDNQSKQTKLQKFLKTIDDHTINQISKYLIRTDAPISNERTNKNQKIKLWHDLSIIQKFKLHEKQINARGRTKIIQQLCNQLKDQLNFSAATIKERIQKKLTNITKQTILNHIQQEMDFSFDTKRKLMPISLKSKKVSNNYNKDELSFEESSSNNQFKVERRVQIIHSSASQSSKSVEEVEIIQKIPLGKQRKRKVIHQQQGQDESKHQLNESINILQNNTFCQLSDHGSDEEYTYQYTNEIVKPGSQYISQLSEKVLQIMKEYYKTSLKNDAIPQKMSNIRIEDEASLRFDQNLCPQQQSNKTSEENKNININQNNQKSEQKQQQNMMSLNNQNSREPSPEELRCFNSLQEWRIYVSNEQENKELKWYPQQDQYLANIINNPDIETAISQIQLFMKFRTSSSILARIDFLNLHKPNHIIIRLITQ